MTNEKEWIGKLCWLWDVDDDNKTIDVLVDIIDDCGFKYETEKTVFMRCRPVKRDEVEFAE